IKPISNTVEILVTGLDAASFNLLASNFGLKSRTGKNIWKRTASHIFVALGSSFNILSSFFTSLRSCPATSFSEPASGNLGSSCSTTICFLSRDQPLGLFFSPLGFCKTFRTGSATGRVSKLSLFPDSGLAAWVLIGSSGATDLVFKLCGSA
uniref:Uncharacterized protein n=1 Tax=Gouania willdenowi TaxID=441366 RepID=A0A8C5HMC1_GOUWI